MVYISTYKVISKVAKLPFFTPVSCRLGAISHPNKQTLEIYSEIL